MISEGLQCLSTGKTWKPGTFPGGGLPGSRETGQESGQVGPSKATSK